jgi:hypothetical protein
VPSDVGLPKAISLNLEFNIFTSLVLFRLDYDDCQAGVFGRNSREKKLRLDLGAATNRNGRKRLHYHFMTSSNIHPKLSSHDLLNGDRMQTLRLFGNNYPTDEIYNDASPGGQH